MSQKITVGQIDSLTATAAEINLLDGSTAGTVVNSKAVIYGASGEVNATTLQVGGVSITSTPAELNILDGVTATTAELNILDGVTSTATELNLLDGVTATTAELNYTDGVTSAIQTQLDAKSPTASPTFTGTPAAPTASAGTNTTQIATTAFVSTAVSNLVDSAPGTLDTLNELAAALGDDANFSTTVTNSIATKLPLAGGTMTGNIVMSGAQTVDGRDLSVDGTKLDGIESGATADQTASEILTAIKTVDGAGSGLDADLLDGVSSASFLRSDEDDTASGSYSFTNSYNEFGNATGSVSNDGGWAGRVNVAGAAHARLDVNCVNDGIITTMYSHTGQGTGRVGTMSNHPLTLMANGVAGPTVNTSGYFTSSRYYAGSASGYFFNDTSTRTAFTGGDLYIQGGVTNYYNYATNQYHGDSSGTNHYFRGNTLSGNSWSLNSAGTFTGISNSAKYADLAERYTTDADYEAGTVVVFGGEAEVTQSTQRLDRRVAGIVSTDPAYLMNSELENSVAVGLQGRVPCKVVGEIRKGDMMVTSSTPGRAEAWHEEGDPPMGTVIGKALENKTDSVESVIEVVVGRM